MKNKNIIDTLNTILPSNDEKEKILSNILNNKNLKHSKFRVNSAFKIVVLASSLCITFFLAKEYYDKPLDPNTRMTPMTISNSDIINFSYNNVIYERLGEISNLNNLKGDLLFVIKDNNNPFFGAEVYKNKANINNTVLVYFNGIYEEYKICK